MGELVGYFGSFSGVWGQDCFRVLCDGVKGLII